jgi:hypothetical protein
MHSLFDEMQSLFRVVNLEAGSEFCPKKVKISKKPMVGGGESGRPNSDVRLTANNFSG